MAENVEASGIVDVPLAQTGEGIAECELIKWFVKEVGVGMCELIYNDLIEEVVTFW